MAKPRSAALVVLLALMVVAAVGVTARLLLKSDGGAPAGAAARAATPTPADLGSGDGATMPPAERVAQRVELGSSTPLASFESLAFNAGPPDGFAVHVVDARDGRPLAGARVAVVLMPAPDHDLSEENLFDELLRHIDAETHGFLADSNGIARVRWPAGSAWVVGESGELRGARRLFTSGHDEFRLELAPTCRIVVEVVNARGAPLLGARVGWATRDEKGRVALTQTPTAVDAHGFAALERFRRPDPIDRRSGEPSQVLGVAVPWVGRSGPDPALFVPVSDPAPATLRCVVPGPWGVIAARVVDEFGRLPDDDVRVTCLPLVRPVGKTVDGVSDVFVIPSDRSIDSITLVAGSGTLAPVWLGLDFRLQAAGEPMGLTAPVELHGPRADGETVCAELKWPVARRCIHGRLVGAARPTRVVACLSIAARRPWNPGGRSYTWNNPEERPVALSVAIDGTFAIEKRVNSGLHGETLSIVGIDEPTGDAFEATASLPDDSPSADVDLGEIRVSMVPILAAGRVLSFRREPLAGVGVGVEILDANDFVPTDGEGRFLFVGEASGTSVVLRVLAPPGYGDATPEVAAGTRDAEIVLERIGALAGRLRADRPLTLLARPHGGGSPTVEHVDAEEVERSRGFRPNGARMLSAVDASRRDVDRPMSFLLRPGRYDVIASLGGSSPEAAVVGRVDDVEVIAGETTRDPRLDPFDLRGLIGRWRFTVERSDGAPSPSTWVRIAPVDGNGEFLQTLYLGLHGAECDSALASAWIDVACPGFRHLHELRERGEVKLVLEPVESHPLVVHVVVPTHARPDELAWRVSAEPSWTAPVDGLDWFSAPVGSDGNVRLELDEGEKWKIHLYAVLHPGDHEKRQEIDRLARQLRNEDLESGALELRLLPEEVAEQVEALGPPH